MAPHSVEAEESVLGSILLNPKALLEVAPFLKTEDFYIVRHQWIWETILTLHNRRDPIDFTTVVNELEQLGRIEEIGGAAYILNLVNNTETALHAEGYGRIVERAAVRRRLIGAASRVAQVAHDSNLELDEVVERSEQAIFEVTERRLDRDLVPIKSVVSNVFDRVDHIARHSDELMGVPTDFKDLDTKLSGMQKSDLLIVAGRPGMGKTSLLLSIVLNAARHNQRVALFSLEMSNEQVVQRFLSGETRIPSQRFREGNLDDKDWSEFVAATQALSKLPIHLDDTPLIGTQEMRTKARRLHMEYGLDLILVDYLQLMTSSHRTDNRVQEISYISRSLKGLARDLNIPVLAAAQLSRAVEQRQDKRPMLSDLRESGSIEQDADVVMFIYRDEYYNPETTDKPNVAEVSIAKHRNGPTGIIELYFESELAQFKNAARVRHNTEAPVAAG
jgi:replicative DNA helicase